MSALSWSPTFKKERQYPLKEGKTSGWAVALQGGAVTCPAPLLGRAPVPVGNEAPLGDGSNMCLRGTYTAGSIRYACTCAECDVGACGGAPCTRFLSGCAAERSRTAAGVWLLTVLPGCWPFLPRDLEPYGSPCASVSSLAERGHGGCWHPQFSPCEDEVSS